VLVGFESRLSAGGVWEEDGEVWSQDGRLLAQSRQLAMIRDPDRS
jgi:acyl-CoA thioesterase